MTFKMNQHRMIKTLILAITLLCVSNVYAIEREKTDLYFTAGLFATGNLFISDFISLPNYPNNSPGFTSAFTIRPGINIGFEKDLKKQLFAKNLRYIANIRASLMSANYSVDEFVGYDITETAYSKLHAEHALNTTIPTILIENSIAIYPFETMPISFKLGLNLGVMFGQTFEQSETLQRDDRYYENGTEILNAFSGDLPDANPFYAGLTCGVRYEGFPMGNLKVHARTRF